MNVLRGIRHAPKRALLGVVLAIVALAAYGCGDSEGEQLKIAFLADYSGPLAEFGPEIQKGAELAIQHINEAGGVNGQDVLLVTGDTGLDETKAVEEARRLVDVEGVHAIVGPLASGITAAVAESVTIDAEVPTITPSGTSPALTGIDDNGFLLRSTISDAAQGVVLAQLATDEGIGSVGVLFENSAYGQGLAAVFEANYGGEVKSSAYESGQASYLAELQSVGDTEYLVAIGYPTDALIFVREALENDVFANFLFVDGTKSQDLIDGIGGDLLDGFKGTAPASDENSGSLAAWNDAYTAVHGELPTRPFVREAYDAVIAIALAAESAGSLEGADLAAALLKIATPGGTVVIPGADSVKAGLEAAADGDDINYEGAATTLDWDAAGDVTSGFVGIWAFEGGEIVELETVPFSIE
ncbi:MAG: ABC transporter substrate-binding protein [Dehalococcoidia bacterium]|jgi:branched-chain amino acid transport system substrate-binding protein|nr:ABC transporter substrate-binding protein [Dehalococcoidia bacterium]